MRAPTLLLSLAAAALLLPPAPASAAESSRRRPRVTRPSSELGAEESDALPAPKPRKTRRNTLPIDGEPPAAEEPAAAKPAVRFSDDDDAPPPPKRAAPAPAAVAPDAEDGAFEDEGRPRRRRPAQEDDDAELRRSSDDDPPRSRSRPRRSRTAEEELGDGIPEIDERLSGLDEPGNGLAAELQTGVMWLDYATGGTKARFTIGLNFTWQLGRVFAPENELLHKGLFLEGSYLHASLSEGTREVQVASSYHYLSAAVLAGYPFTNVLVYGKFGPAMAIMPVEYDVQGAVTEFSGVKGGVVYGLGARAAVYVNDQVGVVGRLELIRYRRQYLDDTLLVLGVGAAF